MEATAVARTPSAIGDNKTVRISNIPISISRAVLREYLKVLEHSLGFIAKDSTGDPYLSLAPDASDEDCQRFQAATVTFSKLQVDVPSVVSLGPPGATFEGTVDTHFRGLTPLNKVNDPAIDIIAVTGLAGHAFGSWRSRESPRMWLRDLLPKDMEDNNGYSARILVYGYDTTLNGSHSYAGVDDLSKQFLEAVIGARGRNPTRPLILIGHSLGGLIIKEAIVESFGGSPESTLRACAGILFFGVPHKGLAEAGLICMVHGQPNENLVRDLCKNSQFLRSLDQSFGHQINPIGMGPQIVSFYETKDTLTVKEVTPGVWARCGPYVRMVTEKSVKHAVENGQYIPMDADHSSIVKFTNRSDQHYQIVRRKLCEITLTISTTPTEPKAPCEERIKICRWLLSGPFDQRHVEISGKRQEKSGGWLLAHDRFISWIDMPGPRLLWGCGIPGAGKTFLSSLVIDVLETRSSTCQRIGVAYVYFNYKDENQQMPVAVLRSLIKQLISRPHAVNSPLPQQVKFLYNNNCAAESTPKLKELKDALIESLKLFTLTFFVFDALDECQEDIRKDLLPLIHWIAGSGGSVFLTSRPYPQDIAISLSCSNPHVQRVDIEAKEEDVAIYVEEAIEDHTSARDLIKGDFRKKVVSRLVEACKGMFLLVHFYIEDLCQYPTPNEILRALDGIHSHLATEDTLNGTYSRAMKSIRNQHKSRVAIALKALTWLLTARRTLRIGELRTAVRMSGGLRLGDPTLFDEADMPDPAFLLNVCCGLVILDTKSNTIKFAHYSVQEYLERTSAIGGVASRHLAVALDCVDYTWLSSIDPQKQYNDVNTVRATHGLSDYIRCHFHTHMRACRDIYENNEEIELLLKFLRDEDVIYHLCCERVRFRGLHDRCSALHEATAWGSIVMVRRLLNDMVDMPLWQDGAGVTFCDYEVFTPLHLAAGESLVDIARFWLENGIDVDLVDDLGRTPLYHAISGNSLGTARLLLEKGAEVGKFIEALEEPGGGYYELVLDGDINGMELLFEFGLSPDQMIFGSTLLCWAGSIPEVEFLLGKGARMDIAGEDGMTPLHLAAEEWDCGDILRVLLNHGTETGPNVPACRGSLAAHVLHAPACIDARCNAGQTPLHKAAINSWTARKDDTQMLAMLLDAGADIHACDGKGRTALHHVCRGELYWGDLRPQLLVGAGAVVDARDRRGQTPLMYVIRKMFLESTPDGRLRVLLGAGADVNAADKNGCTALHLAVKRGQGTRQSRLTMLAFLLDAGAHIDARDSESKTPLHYAVQGTYHRGRQEDVGILVGRGADVNARDMHGRTPLMMLVERKERHRPNSGQVRRGEAQVLVEAGADVNAVETGGQQLSVLHLAVQSCDNSSDVLAMLLESGADVHARDSRRGTPLHHAVMVQKLEWRRGNVALLLGGGADVDARDMHGNTPLMLLVIREMGYQAPDRPPPRPAGKGPWNATSGRWLRRAPV